MSILAQTKADNFSISDLQVIIPPTLAALSSTSAEVRVAAIPALQRFFKVNDSLKRNELKALFEMHVKSYPRIMAWHHNLSFQASHVVILSD